MNKETLSLLENIWDAIRYTLFEFSGHKVSILSLVSSAGIFYLTIQASRYGERAIERLLADRKDIDRGVKDSIKTFARYAILIGGGLVALDTVGVKTSSLAAVGAVLMVGIGFGLQNITQNFISGLIILFERPIKVGDFVEVEGVSGRVLSIGARSTLVNTRDDISIIVPNSQFISEQVVNETLSGDRIRYHIPIGVAYGTDPRRVEEVLMKIAKEHDKVLAEPAPEVFFKDFGNSSLDFVLTVWVAEIWRYEAILSDLRFMISQNFQDEGIEIPFPQMDIHWKNAQIPLRS